MKKWLSLLIALHLLLLCGCSVFKKTNTDTAEKGTTGTTAVTYEMFQITWPYYLSIQEMVDTADGVFLGTVTDISFTVWDTEKDQPMTDTTPVDKRELQTIYHITVGNTYKGNYTGTVKLACEGGRANFKTEVQRRLCADARIPFQLFPDYPTLKVGEKHIFSVKQKTHFVRVINVAQGLLKLEDPFKKQSGISCQALLSYFSNQQWTAFWKQWKIEHPLWEQELKGDSLKQAKVEK